MIFTCDNIDAAEAYRIGLVNKVVAKEELMETAKTMAPFMPSTARIINKSLFERMKPHAYLVNTCRGGVIDEADLIEALRCV